MSARKNPPILSFGELTGRVYIVTRYTQRGDGVVVASEKFDVTASFDVLAPRRAAAVAEAAVPVAEPLPVPVDREGPS
jgi:hypothetical protein